MRNIIAILSSTVLCNLAYAEEVVNLTSIAGKSETEVSAVLGQPSSCGKSKYGKKCQYIKGETEIVYINEKADWITVEGIDKIPFSKEVLKSLGLKVKNPSFSNEFTLRWNSIEGIMEVSVFKGESTSDYAYIKVKTK